MLRQRAVSLALLLALAVLAGCGPVHQFVRPTSEDLSKIKTLAVVVPNEGPFNVIFDRAKATVAPAILFGLLGAGIAAAHNQSLDDEKVKALSPHLSGFSSRSTFLESFGKALRESGRFSEIQVFDKELEAGEAEKYDAVLSLKIQDWGLRLPAASEADRLAGFIEMEAKLRRVRDNQTLWDEHDTSLGQGRHFFSEYEKNGRLLRSEMEEAIGGAGGRVAARLLYP